MNTATQTPVQFKYRAFRKGLRGLSTLIPWDTDPSTLVHDTSDYYMSLFLYNDEHKTIVDKNKSFTGITDNVTNKLVFDFDSKTDINLAKADALNLALKFVDLGVGADCMRAFFSGMKGFGLEIDLNQYLTSQEVKSIISNLSKEFKTLDTKIHDSNRIIRVVNSRHQESGLYKIPLELYELEEWSVDQIKEAAKSKRMMNVKTKVLDFSKIKSNLVTKLPDLKVVRMLEFNLKDLDFTKKIPQLSNCKFALQNGYFSSGNRSHALMVVASTYKNLGFDLEHTYRFLKGTAELQAKRTGQERFSDEEIYNNICMQVYSPHWNGGSYSCKVEGWLQDYCDSLGTHKCKREVESTSVTADETFSLFNSYAINYEKNVLFSGIESLDDNCRFLVGTSNCIIGAPGAGKTTMTLEILNHNSKKDIPSLFFSYDMFNAAVYTKLIQRHFGYSQDKIYKLAKDGSKEMDKIKETITEEYKNVRFCFKSGQTIEDLESTIVETEEKMGKKLKLVIIDYNELINTNLSDSTASSALVAQRLRQIANERQVCIITLLQPSKLYSSVSDEVTSYNNAKGSGSIAQAATVILGISRPGFNPLNSASDKFMNITCVKNRNGPLFSVDLGWKGATGRIFELNPEDEAELSSLREEKNKEKADKLW